MTHRFVKLVKQRRRVYSRYKDVNHPAYTAISDATNKELRKARRSFEKKLATNIKSDTKSFFAYVRSKSSSTVKTGPLVDDSGVTMESDVEMAERLSRYFASVFTEEDLTSVPTPEPVFTGPSEEALKDIDISEEIIRKHLRKLRVDKASGADDLSPRLLLMVSDLIERPLAIILQKSMESGIVPMDWRLANVAPVFKKGRRTECENYRPISLTSQICKMFETIIRDAIVTHLEVNDLIGSSQHGFRNGHSCLSNLLCFLDKVTGSIKDGIPSDVGYLDFAKAFDKVPHQRLLAKLRAHGIGGNLLKWIESWLKDRKQRVCLRGSSSSWSRVGSGVPQGSVLGPVLFLIFINDLDLGVTGDILKFADDTKLLGRVENEAGSVSLQDDLNRLMNWSTTWQMQFNASKCKVMHIGNRNPKYSYSMNQHVLEETSKERDLGYIMSSDAKPSFHCHQAYSRANRMLGLISRTFVGRDPRILLCLYKTLVRPHLEYAVSAWSPQYKKDKALLERIQHRFTRMFPGFSKLSYEDRLQRLGLWSLEERRNRADLIEVYKILTGLSSSPSLRSMFVVQADSKTRGHSKKLYKQHSSCVARKHFFSERVINRWNSLSSEAVDAPSLNSFKNHLAKLRTTQMSFFMDQ